MKEGNNTPHFLFTIKYISNVEQCFRMAYCPAPPTQRQTCFGSYIIASVPFEWRKTEKRRDVHASQMVGDPCWVPVNVWTWLIAVAALCSAKVYLCRCGWRLAHSAPQEFKSDKEQGQTRLNAVLAYGEQVSSVVPADRLEAIRTKANAAKDDWKSLMDSLQRRETALQVELRRYECTRFYIFSVFVFYFILLVELAE